MEQVLLINGSPKNKNSTSLMLGQYILRKLSKKNFKTDTIHLLSMLNNNLDEIFEKISESDLLILSFPLYVDSLPSHVMKFFEVMSKNNLKHQKIMAIGNCGFPESFHIKTALKICKNFAEKKNLHWIGGLAIGAGPMFNGRSIEEMGFLTRKLIQGFNMVVLSIIRNEEIKDDAKILVSRKVIPTWAYKLIGNKSFKKVAKMNNIKIYDTPYQ